MVAPIQERSATRSSSDAPVHAVPLAKLPPNFYLPASLADRIWYDAEHGRLVYRGFMSGTTFQQLAGLSPDLAYLKAVHELFHLCQYQAPLESRQGGRWLPAWMALSGGLLAAAVVKLML